MVPLIYSGNGAVAIDLFRDTWPPDLPGRQENLEYFLKQLGSVTTKGSPIDSIQDVVRAYSRLASRPHTI